MAVLGLLVVGLSMPAPAVAASGGLAPDPAPQMAPAVPAASSPAPDPAPQTLAVAQQPAASSPTSASGETAVRASTPPTAGSAPSGGSIRASRSLLHVTPGVSARRPRSTTASKRTPLLLGFMLARGRDLQRLTAGTDAPAGMRRDGVLLLLSAVALAMFVIASLALLRLVRLDAELWEGRTR